MFRIRELDHLVLCVVDLPSMLHFYTEVLGCTVERRQEALGLLQLRAGRSLIDFMTSGGPPDAASGSAPGAPRRNLDHFCLRIEPFDEPALRAHFAAAGILLGAVASRYGAEGEGPSIYLQDPDGNTVELKGPPGPGRPAAGAGATEDSE